MRGKDIALIIFLLLLLVGASVAYIILDSSNKSKTSEDDAFCEIDTDCTVKVTGCNCNGEIYSCMNIDAKDQKCKNSILNSCEGTNPMPRGCECINNTCQSS